MELCSWSCFQRCFSRIAARICFFFCVEFWLNNRISIDVKLYNGWFFQCFRFKNLQSSCSIEIHIEFHLLLFFLFFDTSFIQYQQYTHRNAHFFFAHLISFYAFFSAWIYIFLFIKKNVFLNQISFWHVITKHFFGKKHTHSTISVYWTLENLM